MSFYCFGLDFGFLSGGAGVEGAGLRDDGGEREADAGVRGEPAEGAEAPQHCAILRPHHRPDQHHAVHRHGALRGRRPVQPHHQVHQGTVRHF